MQVLQAQDHACNEEFGLFFSETAVSTDVIAEVSTRHQVNYQVQVVAVFERVVHVHKEWVSELTRELFLVHDGVDTSF